MRIAGTIVPAAVPQILGEDRATGCFAMAYLPADRFPVWKALLAAGVADLPTATAVGDALGRIHAATADRPDIAARFPTDDIFFAIRLEPYLLATARRHPDVAAALEGLVHSTQHHALALVHGDVSPKNILIGPKGPILLDAECAWWGDPAFDIAFCLNHLLLKCVWTPSASAAFMTSFDALATAYLAGVDWEPRAAIERRAAALLPGLLLARVDGKSPVEYIETDAQREPVRRVGRALLNSPVGRLDQVAAAWREEIGR